MKLKVVEKQEEEKIHKRVDAHLSLYKCFSSKTANVVGNAVIDCFYQDKIEVISDLFFPLESIVHVDVLIPDFYEKRLVIAPLQGSQEREFLHMYARVISQKEEEIGDKLYFRTFLKTVITDLTDLSVFKDFIGIKK
jgi:hypothetical protein